MDLISKAVRAWPDATHVHHLDYSWQSGCGTFVVDCEAGKPQRIVHRVTGEDWTRKVKRELSND